MNNPNPFDTNLNDLPLQVDRLDCNLRLDWGEME